MSSGISLRVVDIDSIPIYNRILVLTHRHPSPKVISNFEEDCKHVGINYAILTNVGYPLMDGIVIGNTLRYYAMSKGEIVGMEVGHRQGDAIKLLSDFGHEAYKGGLQL